MKKTLFILGAGSSKSIHSPFPTGLELIKLIDWHLFSNKKVKNYDANCPYISPMVNELFRNFKEYFPEEVNLLKDVLWHYVHEYMHSEMRKDVEAISIDDFISEKIKNSELNERTRDIVQYAISYLLIGCEESYRDKYTSDKTVIERDNWINSYMAKIKTNSLSTVLSSLTVVSFNYDRLFEYLFDLFIRKYFDQDSLSKLEIKQMYGSLGLLSDIEFGIKNDNTQIMSTVYKNFHLLDVNRPPLQWNEDFDQILFLGFGFNSKNLENLNLSQLHTAQKIGFCFEKTPNLEQISKTYGIEMRKSKSLKDFIEAHTNW